VVVLALAAAGYAVTLVAFYPGYLTTDAGFVYGFIKNWRLGDWQSPLMSVLWALIDPVAPGPGSMFLLIASAYWAAFAILGLTISRRSTWIAIAVPVLAFVPPAFLMLSMIWRDVLFAVTWLLAATIAYCAAEQRPALRLPMQAISLVLVGFGLLLRPNAAVAAAVLAAYVLWPARLSWKRAAIAFLPALAIGIALVQVVYYDLLGAAHEHPEQSLMVFDLGGITRFTGENQFPATWNTQQTALLTTDCYDPARWDTYWTIPPCDFVMKRLEDPGDTIFGTPRLRRAWMHALAAHPLAYLRHRLTFFWHFLWAENVTLQRDDIDDPVKTPIARNVWFKKLLALHDTLAPTALFRTGLWLVLAVAAAFFGLTRLRAREPCNAAPAAAFAVGVCGSATLYVMTFLLVGVAGDFRYGYWCVLAALAGAAAALTARRA
jgi:hypothetical protein